MSSRHYVFAICSNDPSPTSNGTKEGWLRHYKLAPKEPAYVRLDPSCAACPDVGDTLWFQVDDRVIARAQVSDIVEDPLTGALEVWYDGEKLEQVDGLASPLPPQTARVPEELAATWLDYLRLCGATI